MLNTPLKDLKVKQTPAMFAAFCFMGLAAGLFAGLIIVLLAWDEQTTSADELARQIAEGTHKGEATTNAFGTMEWRVVEVEEGME